MTCDLWPLLQDLDSDEPELSDWVLYAAEEYEILVAEEGATDVQREDWWVAAELQLVECQSEYFPETQFSPSQRHSASVKLLLPRHPV